MLNQFLLYFISFLYSSLSNFDKFKGKVVALNSKNKSLINLNKTTVNHPRVVKGGAEGAEKKRKKKRERKVPCIFLQIGLGPGLTKKIS